MVSWPSYKPLSLENGFILRQSTVNLISGVLVLVWSALQDYSEYGLSQWEKKITILLHLPHWLSHYPERFFLHTRHSSMCHHWGNTNFISTSEATMKCIDISIKWITKNEYTWWNQLIANQCLKLSQKSCSSSWLESQIINIKLKKVNKKFPVFLQSCWPWTGRPVGISNTVANEATLKNMAEYITCIMWRGLYNYVNILWATLLNCRDHSGYRLSQWETMLHCNVVPHWLSPYPELFLEPRNCMQAIMAHTLSLLFL